MHFAAFKSHKKIAELLIEKGVYVNAKGVTGDTPLDEAIMRKHVETADLLRKHAARRLKN